MVESRWSVTDDATTGARWGLLIDLDSDGRGATVSRDPTWTDLSNVQTGSIAVEFTSRADNGAAVAQGATWNDLARPVRFDWAAYGREVDLRFYGRTSGVWGRSAGVPAGQPRQVSGGAEAARFEVGEDGLLRPLSFGQTDWKVEDRPAVQPSAPALRYTTIEAVKGLLKAPAGREAAVWQSGGYDTRIAGCVRAAEQRIDSHCGRVFDLAAAAASARVYRRRTETVVTDDFVGEAAVSVGGADLPGAVWSKQPVSASYRGVYQAVRLHAPNLTPDQMHGFDLDLDPGRADVGWHRGPLPDVTVSARWGWPRVPDDITYVAGLLALRLFRRPDEAALGVMNTAGGPAWVSRFDPDVEALLAPFTKLTRPDEVVR